MPAYVSSHKLRDVKQELADTKAQLADERSEHHGVRKKFQKINEDLAVCLLGGVVDMKTADLIEELHLAEELHARDLEEVGWRGAPSRQPAPISAHVPAHAPAHTHAYVPAPVWWSSDCVALVLFVDDDCDQSLAIATAAKDELAQAHLTYPVTGARPCLRLCMHLCMHMRLHLRLRLCGGRLDCVMVVLVVMQMCNTRLRCAKSATRRMHWRATSAKRCYSCATSCARSKPRSRNFGVLQDRVCYP